MDLKNLSHYQILDKIGSGGMGEVYLAEDPRLDRRVAIKILTGDFAKDPAKVSRFEREAKAASALNHPNILTVYDVGKADLTNYIVTEYVNGRTIRDILRDGRFSVEKALSVVSDVAKALAAAHEAGIIHRDIKPENIMIRNDGYVKVLDFGLAKMLEIDFRENALVVTEPGQILGTPKYMSPEQIRGHEVDARTDIFSLGVVLYEMLTGVPPFDGSTVSDVIASVLRSEPRPVRELADDLPVAVENTVNRALAKEPDLRQRKMRQFLFEIEQTTSDLKSRGQDASITLAMGRDSGDYGGQDAETIPPEAVLTPQRLAAQTSANVVPTKYASRTAFKYLAIGTAIAVAILLPLVFTIAWWPWVTSLFVRKTRPIAAPPGKTMQFDRITTNGKAIEAAVSKDGKYLTYVLEESNGKTSLWTRHIPTSRNIQVVPASNSPYQHLTFSADGNYVYFIKNFGAINGGEILAVPVLGGSLRTLAKGTNSGFAVAPDDRKVVFSRFSDNQNEVRTFIANTDGTDEHIIARRSGDEYLDWPAFSPDGTKIALVAGGSSEGGESIVEIVLEGLKEFVLPGKWSSITNLKYSPDSSALVVIGKDHKNSRAQIWKVPMAGAEAVRITNDLNSYSGLSITSDSRDIITTQRVAISGIWIGDADNLTRAAQLTRGSGGDGTNGICWTTDGRILYTSSTSGETEDIWISNADGSDQHQLTSNAGANLEPAVTPDGRYIVFSSNRAGKFSIWKMDIDGNNAVKLTEATGQDRTPQVTPDGRWVVYVSTMELSIDLFRFGVPPGAILKVSIDGGAGVRIVDRASLYPSVSPDGKTLAFLHKRSIVSMPIDLGDTKNLLDLPNFGASGVEARQEFDVPTGYIRWRPQANVLSVAVTKKGSPQLWTVWPDGREPTKDSDYDGNPSNFSWSPDGRKLAFSRSAATSDIVKISGW